VKIALGSDEKSPLTDEVAEDLKRRGHSVVLVGPPGNEDLQWAAVGRKVGTLVASSEVDTAVLFCWTGTGASIAANKVPGARAALCTDAQTAAGSRKWNDANVIVMSLRSTTPTMAAEMLDAWFSTDPDPSEAENISSLEPTSGSGT
jgi:ribose 5-phosphate isomerase B